MNYFASASTDVGIVKETNQDSVCVKIAEFEKHGQVAMAVICDGMGGLSKGELASATVIRRFSNWFEKELPKRFENFSWQSLADEWTRMIAHVGDSRIYEISDNVKQLTEDQTYINREIKAGRMTPQEAAVNPKRNMLLQCVGASREVNPDILYGNISANTVYMLCSDGFRHVLTDAEIFESFNPTNINSPQAMKQNSEYLIDVVKKRNERDNITVALLKSVM